MPLVYAAVTSDPLDPAAHETLVLTARTGAVASFHGVIRDHDPEAAGEVTGIDYSHHPDAEKLLAAMVARTVAEHDPAGLARVAVSHRVGRLEVGEYALVCSVATPHRAEAFALCQALVEVIKAELPIWKRQSEASGRQVWSNLGLEDQ